MIKDLTCGSPRKILLQYSLPLFGSILFQQLYSVADSFVAGRFIDTKALSAVGNSYELTLLYIAFAFGCNIGTSVVVARYFGQKDFSRVRTAVTTGLISTVAIGLLMTAAGMILSKTMLGWIQTPEEIFQASLEYLDIYIAGFLFVLIYNISTGIFSALGDSRTPFFFLAFSSVSNILMDIYFVKTLKLGVPGVAWATLICQGISAVLAFLTVLRRLHELPGENRFKIFSFPVLKELATVAIPSILQQGFVSVGNIIIQGLINTFGTSAIGGYSAAVKLNNMTITSISAFATGMSNFAAQNAGACLPERIRHGTRSGLGLAWGMSLIFTLVYQLAGYALVCLFITDGDVHAADVGRDFLRIVSPFYWVIASKLILDGVFRGIHRMSFFIISTFTDLLLRVLFSFIFASFWGVTGIWLSWPVGWCLAACISFGLYCRVKKTNFGICPE